jgi:hypothetical protein
MPSLLFYHSKALLLISICLNLVLFAGWEEPMSDQLRRIRSLEAGQIARRQRINAMNFALNFAITPICGFATFAVARAMGRTLTVRRRKE